MDEIKVTIYQLADLETKPLENSDLSLIAGVIQQAIADAKESGVDRNRNPIQIQEQALDAVDFLFSQRSDPYFELLSIDPDAAREGILRRIRETTPGNLPVAASKRRLKEAQTFRLWYMAWMDGAKTVMGNFRLKAGSS